jgi:polyisoprenoid-binding protein YceI
MNATQTASTNTNPTLATRWILDAGHSAVGFSVRHLMITNVRGEFSRFRGEVTYDAAHPAVTRITAAIEVGSLDTHEAKRDADLRSPVFFDAESHPELTVVSKAAQAVDGGDLLVTGDLTIRGVTREVALSVRDVSAPQIDMRGNRRIGATATAKINRSDFGMTWNKGLETGGVVVGDVVTITIEVSLVKAD